MFYNTRVVQRETEKTIECHCWASSPGKPASANRERNTSFMIHSPRCLTNSINTHSQTKLCHKVKWTPRSRWSLEIVLLHSKWSPSEVNYSPPCDQCCVCSTWVLYQRRPQLAKRNCVSTTTVRKLSYRYSAIHVSTFLQPDV